MSYLVDIEKLRIDDSLEKPERLLRYLSAVENPYRFRVGDTIVNIAFAENGSVLQDALANAFVNN